MFFSIIKIYLFIFLSSRIFIPLLVFSLLVTTLLCLVTPRCLYQKSYSLAPLARSISDTSLCAKIPYARPAQEVNRDFILYTMYTKN